MGDPICQIMSEKVEICGSLVPGWSQNSHKLSFIGVNNTSATNVRSYTLLAVFDMRKREERHTALEAVVKVAGDFRMMVDILISHFKGWPAELSA